MKWHSASVVLYLALSRFTTTSAQSVQPDVQAFIQAPSFPRSYRELSASYDASVTPQLIAMLESKAEEPYADRVAAMLGAVGDERAVDALIAFVEKPAATQRLDRTNEDARKAAIISLGVLINRTGNERAIRYLTDGLTPSIWRARNVVGLAPWTSSYQEYDLELSKYALFGLAMSGNPRAGQALRSLQQMPTPEQAQFRRGLDDTLAQWLEVHRLVGERGIAGMYDYYETRKREVQ